MEFVKWRDIMTGLLGMIPDVGGDSGSELGFRARFDIQKL